jgi:predicted nucleotidyltransferase component of viral defense system
MNNLVANFEQIIAFAQEYGLPMAKKRAILREYLQTQILEILCREKAASNLIFVGGTALRLLRGLDRFSEDLDFDVINLKPSEINRLMQTICRKIIRQNIKVDFYQNKTEKKTYFELRFTDLLFQLGISQNREEKLMIKLDFEYFWQRQTKEILLLNRYGFIFNLVTKPLNQILVEKLYAYLHREQTQARDLYDLVWLASHQAKFDQSLIFWLSSGII